MLEDEKTHALEFWFDWRPQQDASPFSKVSFSKDGMDLLVFFSPVPQSSLTCPQDQDLCEILISQDQLRPWDSYRQELKGSPNSVCRRFASVPEEMWVVMEQHGVTAVVCGPLGVLARHHGKVDGFGEVKCLDPVASAFASS